MRKLILIASAITICIGCSKKNNPTPAQASIVGTWYATTDTLTTYSSGKPGSPTVTNFNHSYYIRFNADATGVQFGNGGNTNFTYTISGKTATINYAEQNDAGTITPAFTEHPTIGQLDAHNLYLIYDDSSSHTNGDVEATRFTR